IAPWVNTAISVVPPPMSTRHTPRSFSSSDSTARDDASGCRIRSPTSMPQRRTHLMMFCAAETAPVTMCTFTSSRTPDMPIGSRTSSWPSMMNSWRSTCRICWSVGMFTARAVSSARSTSSAVTSRSLIATMPVELKLRMWLPAMPTKAEVILQSAISSASSSARWIAATVASMFTTTPFFRPFDSWLPRPSTSSAPSGRSSATRHTTFAVPMSRATIRFLLSRAIRLAPPIRNAQREAVGIAQVHVVVARRSLGGGLHEAFEAHLRGVGVAAQRESHAAAEAQLPRQPRREDDFLDARAERRDDLVEARVAARDLAFAARRARQARQPRLARAVEALAKGVDQASLAPVGERHVLFQRRLEAVGPDAAHRRAAHPRQALQRI